MKRITALLVFSFFLLQFTQAQHIPQGMKYQAVARDLDGKLLSNEEITIEINLHSDLEKGKSEYTEQHTVLTNELGLFSLTVGDGQVVEGKFKKIPWSTEDIYMAISIQDLKSGDFVTISDSKLLAVPYAFHAATASQLSGNVSIRNNGNGNGPGVPSQNWSLFGNSNSDPTKDKLGTTDYVDLVMITNNIERLRITAAGDIDIANDLHVGSDVTVDSNLVVHQNVDLNVSGGNTDVFGDLTVNDMSTTHLTGDLNVNKDLTVNGATNLNGALTVLGVSIFENRVSIDGHLVLEDSLSVLSNAPTLMTGSLDVNGKTTLNNEVEVNSTMALQTEVNGFLATFENTSGGDNNSGLNIKLGKTHPRYNDNIMAEVRIDLPGIEFIEGAVGITEGIIRDFINNGGILNGEDFISVGNEMLRLTEDQFGPGFDFLAASACNLTREIIEGVNTNFLPVPLTVTLPEIDVFGSIIGDIGFDLSVGPSTLYDGTLIPTIPLPSCSSVPAFSESFTLPTFQLVDVNNSLSSSNKFIQFTDKYDNVLGAIEAQSIEEWGQSYLNPTFFLNIFNSFAGVTVIGIDPTQIAETAVKYVINGVAQVSTIIDDYNSIGVQYNSGFGDYAEWLEREDHTEYISAGDIVAVKGGKITKNLEGAEQIMAVSTNPIVLGNAPDAAEAHEGNNIAFMGQIPVKIMGPVQSGDFIVANDEIPGYGIAIHPSEMTVEDYENTVGRSWENMASEGPKMVNTVIGVHNGNMVNIMKEVVEKQKETDERLSSIEEQLNSLIPLVNNN